MVILNSASQVLGKLRIGRSDMKKLLFPITAGDFKAVLDQLTPEELNYPILVGLDDEHEFLTMTVTNSFDRPMVKLLTSATSSHGRVRVIRV